MSAKFAALAKKERMARMASQTLRQKEAAISERERMITERERQWNEEFKQSPLEAIKKRGYSYEDLTKAALNDGKFDAGTELKSVRDEIQRMQQAQIQKEEEAKKAQESQQSKEVEDTVNAFKGRISEVIQSKNDTYELVSLHEAHDLVYQTVEEHYGRTLREGKPKILSIEEACALVEDYLETEIERTAQKSKKFQSKYKVAGTQETAKGQQQATQKNQTTLTNQYTSTSPSLLPAATEADRIKRALAALG